eukprot:CAMPEP_0113248260 /NCGR_PEP_ID=MMETSP0008_2-20120614/10423_1 /TAXON_ID=97485 /ORGANISM="Prymnesium parvum" /LENGTH=323 /DNA_ID=CAMNT_0000096099 /DNA_START=39 /DNA_END=1010 /DNA_ORIENTATION=+ /assembly_acc=CAM_ASM_000153
MSLSEFTGDVAASNELPTAPREDSSYDDYPRGSDRFERRGREGDRYDRGPRMFEDEEGNRHEIVSEADTVSSWRTGGAAGGGSSFAGGDRFGGGGGGDRYGGGGGDRYGGGGGDRFGGGGGDRFGGGGGDRQGGGERGGDRYGSGDRERYERSTAFNPRGLNMPTPAPEERETTRMGGDRGPDRSGVADRGGGGGGFVDRPFERGSGFVPRGACDAGGGGGGERSARPVIERPAMDDRPLERGSGFVPRDAGDRSLPAGGPAPERRKLQLAPRTKPIEPAAAAPITAKTDPFGGAKPVATKPIEDGVDGLKLASAPPGTPIAR